MFLYEKGQHELQIIEKKMGGGSTCFSSFSYLKFGDLGFKKSDADIKASALNWHRDTTLEVLGNNGPHR